MDLPTTLGGSQTYAGYLPQKANKGEIVTFSDSLKADNPGIQSLLQSGAATAYGDKGIVFMSPYGAGNATVTRTATGLPQINRDLGGGSSLVPNAGPTNPQRQVTYTQRNQNQEAIARANYLASPEGANVQKILTQYQKNGDTANAQALQTAINQRVNMATYGSEEPNFGGSNGAMNDGANGGFNMAGLNKTGADLNGMNGLNGDMSAATMFNQFTGLQEPGFDERQFNVKGDYSDLLAQNEAIKAQQKAVLDMQFNQQMADITAAYEQQRKDTKLKGEQNLAGATTKLNRGGGRNMAATAVYEQGQSEQNQRNLEALTTAQANAEQAARIAYATGNAKIAEAAYANLEKVKFKTTEDLNNQWNQISDSFQKSVNKYQAQSSFLLGAYGAVLEKAGLDLDILKEQNSVEQFGLELQQKQQQIDEEIKQNGIQSAIELGKLLGYYVDPTTGKSMPTADAVKKIAGNISIATKSNTAIDTILQSYVDEVNTGAKSITDIPQKYQYQVAEKVDYQKDLNEAINQIKSGQPPKNVLALLNEAYPDKSEETQTYITNNYVNQ